MILYIWKDGAWMYSWEAKTVHPAPGYRVVDLDRWFDYDLSELEVLACLEALEE